MKQINITKAEPIIKDELIEDIQITISGSPPDHMSLEDARQWFNTQADLIVDAMFNSLPQGTTDRIYARMTAKKAALFVFSEEAMARNAARYAK